MSIVTSYYSKIGANGQWLKYTPTQSFVINGNTYKGVITLSSNPYEFIVTQRVDGTPFHNIQVCENQYVTPLNNGPYLPAEIRKIVGDNPLFLTTSANLTTWFLVSAPVLSTQSNIDLLTTVSNVYITNTSGFFVNIIMNNVNFGSLFTPFEFDTVTDSNIVVGSTSVGGGGGGLTLVPTVAGGSYFVPFSVVDTGAITELDTNAAITFNPATTALTVGSVVTNKIGLGNIPASSTNISVGNSALNSLGAGLYNVAVGEFALNACTGGGSNIGIGESALGTLTIGNGNTAIGRSSLAGCTAGNNNIAIGPSTLSTISTQSNNIAIGDSALTVNAVNDNVAIGINSMISNTTGTFNTALGNNSLISNTIGNSNIAIGNTCLGNNTVGLSNIAIGVQSMSSNTIGSTNISIGPSALAANTTDDSNIAIGANSCISKSSGTSNVSIGVNSGDNLTTGSGNIFIGYAAGTNVGSGDNNIIIGAPGSATDDGIIRLGAASQKSAFIPRTIVGRSTVIPINADTVLTADNLMADTGGMIDIVDPATAVTMPTGAAINTILGNVVAGDTFKFYIMNRASGPITINEGLNVVTVFGGASSVSKNRLTEFVAIYNGTDWVLYFTP